MSEIKWSDNQKSAIFSKYRKDGKSQNILVSAAAGSGKTAVLVQRIIEKIVPKDLSKSIDANKLLVVTFTKAAAGEMLERIEKALKQNLKEAISSGDFERQNHIKRQQLLIYDSDITTIDSFCIKLIRRYFNVLGIAPDFTIADNAIDTLMQDEAMEDVFSELYEEKDADFLNLLCLYASNRSDDGLKKLILQIYSFIVKMPSPLEWLYTNTNALLFENGIKNSLWYKTGVKKCMADIDFAFSIVKKALTYFDCDDVDSFIKHNPPESGIPVFDEWKNFYKLFYTYYTTLKPITDFQSARQSLSGFSSPSFSRLPSKTDEEKDILKAYNEKIKKALAFSLHFTNIDFLAYEKRSKEHLYPVMMSLYDITKRFSERYFEKKLSKNLLTFTDVEQLCYELLSKNPEIANELQLKYEEVLMDEYQDTSILQEEIFSFVTNGSNLFTVGDMKQSIYRFRSSDPTIFKARLDKYSFDEEASDRKIILSQNFRSRKEVLDGINDIFEAIMSEEVGELDYDDSQRLYLGNKDYPSTNYDYRPQCVIIDTSQDIIEESKDELNNFKLEARFVASEIMRLKSQHFMVHTKEGIREIQNRDIVILMSSHKAAADIYTSELNSCDIDCFVEINGYFERHEIQLMTSLFKVINNPYNDIPLLGILRSPIVSFSDNELVLIRKCKKGKFFSALKEYINLNNNNLLTTDEEILVAKKAEKFYNDISRWRYYSRYMPTDKLVWTLYEETDFYAFVGAMFGGEEAQANLRLLFERAKQYESTGFSGLFGFVKYIERLKKKDTDLSAAKLIGENHNVVRIMTIHKSKGLEFPVVFITGGETQFKHKFDKKSFIMHKDYGICIDYINFKDSYTIPSPSKELFRRIIIGEQISEDIRKLYVAMTRAKEKLYFVSAIKKAEDLVKVETENGKLSPFYVQGSKCFADYVIPAANNSDKWYLRNISISELTAASKKISETVMNEVEQEIDIDRILDFKYPHIESCDLPSKVSVSQIKHSSVEIIPKPTFLTKKASTGAVYGTAIHTVLQYFNYTDNMDISYVKAEISRLLDEGRLSKEEYDIINPKKILAFYDSAIGKRIIKSENVHREQNFEVEVPAYMLYPELPKNNDDSVILQGVIDCWFEEDGKIILLDYKTDSYIDINEIHEKYDNQIQLYAYALKKITKKCIKNSFFYLFFDGNVIECY